LNEPRPSWQACQIFEIICKRSDCPKTFSPSGTLFSCSFVERMPSCIFSWFCFFAAYWSGRRHASVFTVFLRVFRLVLVFSFGISKSNEFKIRKENFIVPFFSIIVTRFGEFSPIGRFLVLVFFTFMYRNRPKFWAIFNCGKSYVLIGQIWVVHFFTNSSGHLVHNIVFL
jgi:hypothetical protein